MGLTTKRLAQTAVALAFIMLSCVAVRAGEAAVAGKGFPLRSAAVAAPAQTQPAAPAPSVAAPVGAAPVVSVAPPTQQFEAQPLAFSGDNRRRARSGEDRDYKMPSVWPALLSVAVVCVVFCTILYLVKKYMPGHRQLFSHPAMEVLGRTHLDQRRYVSLLRVGKRIVVVGVSPDEMRALSEITDEEEITGILEVARPKTEAGLTIFQRLFQRNVIDAEAEETKAMAKARTEELDEQMSALRRRVQEIRQVEEPAVARTLDTVG